MDAAQSASSHPETMEEAEAEYNHQMMKFYYYDDKSAQKLDDSEVLAAKNIYLAAQCCEHLNRAIIVERAAVPLYDDVNVIPQPKAGGSFATTAYKTFKEPVAVEHIKADAGLDIGGTLIGMHLKEVAVPLRLSLDHIGNAILLAARTRPKFIGGIRATYNEDLL